MVSATVAASSNTLAARRERESLESRKMCMKIVVGQANADQAVGLVVRIIEAPYSAQALSSNALAS